MIAAALAAASTLPGAAEVAPSARRRIRALLVALMVGWALATTAGIAPLDRITQVERASGPITALALIGAALFVYASVRYAALARERRQLIGDAILATFSEQAGEDDHPLRAARAALAIRDRTAALAERHPGWPRFRIGVNTGEAMVGVVGAGGGRSYTAIGDAVNTASRLESEAPVGAVAISAATMRRLPAPRIESLGHVPVKGKREPVETYMLVEL